MTIVTLKWETAVRLAVAGIAAALLIACGQESPDKLMASAKEYLAKGDRSAAVIQLKNLLAKAPDNGEARLLLGEALLSAEDFVSAEKELSRALELKQPQEKAVPLYVRALLSQGKHNAVVAEVEKYKLFSPPAVADTQTALGDAHVQLGSRSRARDAYAAAMAALPGFPRAKLGEAVLVALEGRTDDALKQVDEVIAAAPTLADARAFRADILLAKGDREGAKRSLEEAIAANGRFLPARISLIGLLIDERNFEAAAKLIDSTRKVAPGDLRVNYLEASLAYRQGDLERARLQVQQVLKFLPGNVQALTLAGAIELQGKQLAAAERNLRTALARAPTHFGARQLLVQTYLRMGQPAKAREVLQPLVASGMPTDPQLLLLAGETYLANGDAKSASAFYAAASKAGQAGSVAARTRLGQIALATGRVDEGFRELEAASELDTDQYQADLAIISGHLRRKEFGKAMLAVQALEKKQPKNPLTFQMHGSVNLAKGDDDAARKAFEKALEIQPNYLPAAFQLAQLDIKAKRPDDARKRYEAMIAKEPNNEQPYLALAELQARSGLPTQDVAATLLRAVSANPQSAAARLALIDLHLRAGDTKAALSAAQNAVVALPSDPRVLDAAGMALERAGEINQAIETYGKLAGIQPQSLQPLYRLAALYFRQKETDKALETLRRAQKIAPSDHGVVERLVAILVEAGRTDEALKEAKDLQKREPKSAAGAGLEGDINLALRRYPEAERQYREALRVNPASSATAIKLHAVLRSSGKKAEAETLARNWLVAHPKDAGMRLHLGDQELAAKNPKAAAVHYQAVLALDRENAMALNNLAMIAGETGDPKALEYAERALRIAPANPAVLDTYGVLLVRKGEVNKGLPYIERAVKLAPYSGAIRLNYARALIKAGRKDDARRELEGLSKAGEQFAGKKEAAELLKSL